MADRTPGQILHEARQAGGEQRPRPMPVEDWADRDPRLKQLDEAMAEAVAAGVRKQYEDRITFIESLASAAKAAAAGYPEHSAAWTDMTARYEAYVKAAAVARGETGGEGSGEP